MWELGYKAEHQRIDAFELWCWRRLLRIPWIARRFNQFILKEINPEYSLEAEAEAPLLWEPDVKSRLIGKAPDAAKHWRWEAKRVTEDEMVGWHHHLNGHEVGQTPRDGGGQESLACCSPWGRKESDMTWQLNNQWENSAWLEEIKDIICRSKWRVPRELWLVIYKTNKGYLSKSDGKRMNVFQDAFIILP